MKNMKKDKIETKIFFQSQLVAIPLAGFTLLVENFFFGNISWAGWFVALIVWIISTGSGIEYLKKQKIFEKEFEKAVD